MPEAAPNKQHPLSHRHKYDDVPNPKNGRRMSAERQNDNDGEDRLGPFREPGGENKATTVRTTKLQALREAGESQKRRAVQVIRQQRHKARYPRARFRNPDSHNNAGVNGKVGHDVEEAAELGRSNDPSDRAIEPVHDPIGDPQRQAEPPLADRNGHAGPDTDREPEKGQVVGTQTALSEPLGNTFDEGLDLVSNRRVKHQRSSAWAAFPAVLVLGSLTIGAVAGVVNASLRPGAIVGGDYSFDAWTEVIADESFRSSIWFTFRTASVATIISVILAVPLAFSLRHFTGSFARTAISTAVPVPHLVAASVIVTWIGPGGLLDRVGLEIPIVGSRFGWGIIAVYVLKEVPFLVLLVHASLTKQLERREAASQSLGAGLLRRWWTVTIPGIAQPLILGSLLVTAFVVGSTEVPAVIGPLQPEAITNWSITRIRLRGPIARADAATALVTASLLVLFITGVFAAGVQWGRGRQRGTSGTP